MEKNKKEILPGVGLGGVNIGMSFGDLDIKKSETKVVNGILTASLESDTIFIIFDSNRVVQQVSAVNDYNGCLDGKYCIGSSVSRLLDDNWFFREDLDGFVHKEYPGVVMRTNLEDATIDEINQNKTHLQVSEISVSITA